MTKKVATEDLSIDGSRFNIAHRKGDVLDADDPRIERFGWADKLVGENTKAAEAAQDDATGKVPSGVDASAERAGKTK
jgi:uncharacterized protein YjbJ (UPF0337 family)